MTRAALIFLALGALLAPISVAHADTNADVVRVLTDNDVYISPEAHAVGHTRPGDEKRILAAIDETAKHGAASKVALLRKYPSQLRDPFDAANHLRNYIGFSGVLVLISPKGIGISSDALSTSEVKRIARKTQPLCSKSYSECAIAAVRASLPGVKAEQSRANRNVAIFWAVSVAVFGLLVVGLVLLARRRQQQIISQWHEGSPDDAGTTAQTGPPVTG